MVLGSFTYKTKFFKEKAGWQEFWHWWACCSTIYLLVQNWALQWSRKILLTLLFFAVVLKMPLKLKQLTFQAQQNKKRKHFWWSQDLRIKRATTMKFKLEEFNSTIFHFQATFKFLIESFHVSYVEHSNWYQNLT